MPATDDSACEILETESERFAVYVFADARIRNSVVDEETFLAGIKKAFRSDVSLRNILGSAGNIDKCLKPVFETKDIQDLIKRNVGNKRKEIRSRVKVQRPELKGKALTKEINRRLKISMASKRLKIKRTEQVTIEQAIRPIKVKYTYKGKDIKYTKTKPKALSTQELTLIKNSIKRGKKPSEVIDSYKNTFPTIYRTETSIRRHYYRTKSKLEAGTLKAMGGL